MPDYYAVIAHADAFKNTASPTSPVQIGLGPQTDQAYPLGALTAPPFSVPRWLEFHPDHQSMFIGCNAGGSGVTGVLADGEGNTIVGNNAGVNMKAGGIGDNTALGANCLFYHTGAATAMTIQGPAGATYSQSAASPYITLKVNGTTVYLNTDINAYFNTVAAEIDALSGWTCTAEAGASGWYIVAPPAGNGRVYTDISVASPTIIEAVGLGGYNTALGVDSQVQNTTGHSNTSTGKVALYANLTGVENCAYGRNSLYNFLGSGATAYGHRSAQNATTATFICAYGIDALRLLTTGTSNCAMGSTALYSVTTGENNCGVGISTGYANTGNENCFVGNNAGIGQSNVNGSTAIGYYALGGTDLAGDAFNIIGPSGVTASYSFDGTTVTLKENGVSVGTFTASAYASYTLLIGAISAAHPTWFTTGIALAFTSPTNGVIYTNKDVSYPEDGTKGKIRTKLAGQYSYNVAIGHSAIRHGKGINNVAIGALSMQASGCIGSDNVCVGASAGYALTSGYENLLIGSNTGIEMTAGYQNIGIGPSTLQAVTTGYQNTATGYRALWQVVSGYHNSAYGYNAGRYVTGTNNTIIGATAMQSASCSGGDNTVVGLSAGYAVTSGQQNTLMGSNAGAAFTTGSYNSAFGYFACQTSTGSYNASFGYHALRQGSGNYNVGIGALALSKADNTASGNVAVGASAGAELLTGTRNVLLGNNQGINVTSGSGNVMVGASTLAVGADITGNSNILIGDDIDLEDRTVSSQINIGSRYYHDRLRLAERSSDPAQPTEGNWVAWMSDGTGLGDDGDVMIAATAGGVIRYTTLFDHSAGTLWA